MISSADAAKIVGAWLMGDVFIVNTPHPARENSN